VPDSDEALTASASSISRPFERIDLASPPAVGPLYLRSLIDRRPASLTGPGLAGRIEGRIREVTPATAALERYRDVCGFRPSLWLPISFPHVLAAGMHLRMLLSPAFPVRLPGLVHVWHEIEQREPIPAGAALHIESWIDGAALTNRGAEFCLHTVVSSDAGTAWKEKTGFLARSKRPVLAADMRAGATQTPDTASTGDAPFTVVDRYPLQANLGRRYARASGDYNPIHLFRITAKAFGFKAAIAHGMWSLARCAAALLPEDASNVRMTVNFKRPLMLPATTLLEAGPADRDRYFRLCSTDGRTTFLSGRMECI
jgi:acyl dehydratase